MSEHGVESGFARVFGAQVALPHAQLVAVECDIARGLHAFAVVGLPDKAVEEAKDRVASAIKNCEDCGFQSPKRSNKKIVVSLAPADLKKEGSAFDLPFALSFLLASEQLDFDPTGKLFAGELALDGACDRSAARFRSRFWRAMKASTNSTFPRKIAPRPRSSRAFPSFPRERSPNSRRT